MRIYDLYFSRTIKGRLQPVSESEWASFRQDVIALNLPDGWTEWDGYGAWLNPKTHITGGEPSKVLEAAVVDSPDSRAAISKVRGAYRQRFHQLSVGMTEHPGCGSFDGNDGAP